MAIDSDINKGISFWKWLMHSGDNTNLGASARKLTIPPFVIFIAYIHWKHVANAPFKFLIADMVFILLLVGLLRTEDLMAFILKLKGKDGSTETKTKIDKDETTTTVESTTNNHSA